MRPSLSACLPDGVSSFIHFFIGELGNLICHLVNPTTFADYEFIFFRPATHSLGNAWRVLARHVIYIRIERHDLSQSY